MRSFGIALFYAFLSLGIWLLDSAFLSFYAEMEFVAALWNGVPMGRLILRIFIMVIIFLFAFIKIRLYRHENGLGRAFVQMRKNEYSLNGNAESRDKSQRVLFHCQNLAAYFNMSEQDKSSMRILCYCYDIGKLTLPKELLNNKKIQTKEDRDFYDRHAEFGAEIIAAFEMTKEAAPLIKYHHEYFNGGGVYGLKNEQIPLACRIFSVAWAYDSMVNPCGRTKSFLCAEALQELRYYEATAFDPDVVEAFIKMMGGNPLFAVVGKKAYSLSRN